MLITFFVLGSASLTAQETMWKCDEPSSPLLFATTEESKNEQTPPCKTWLELRGQALAQLFAEYASEQPQGSNIFLERAAAFGNATPFPIGLDGTPRLTTFLFDNYSSLGYEEVAASEAAQGQIVLYKSAESAFGGFVVEVREGDAPWEQRVLYPSGQRNNELVLAPILSLGEPLVLRRVR